MRYDATTLPPTRDTKGTMTTTTTTHPNIGPAKISFDTTAKKPAPHPGLVPTSRGEGMGRGKAAAAASFAVLTLAAGLLCAGCKGTLGTDSVNVSGSVLTHGTLIGGSLTVASNTVSVGGTVAQGNTTNSGTIAIGN